MLLSVLLVTIYSRRHHLKKYHQIIRKRKFLQNNPKVIGKDATFKYKNLFISFAVLTDLL